MPARTGEQFLKGLRGPREVWVDGERIADVVDHPKLRGAAHALAEVFDLHHKHPDICDRSHLMATLQKVYDRRLEGVTDRATIVDRN